MIILNKAFSYKIRKCILFTDSNLLMDDAAWDPGLPPAKSGPAPQSTAGYYTLNKTVHILK